MLKSQRLILTMYVRLDFSRQKAWNIYRKIKNFHNLLINKLRPLIIKQTIEQGILNEFWMVVNEVQTQRIY